jgi:hypothetical protein
MDWTEAITNIVGIAGFVTGSVSLAITLQQQRRSLKAALQWGIDPTAEKSSGIVLWISIANAGYQPVVVNGVSLHIRDVSGSFAVRNSSSWGEKRLPVTLSPGDMYSLPLSAGSLLGALETVKRQGITLHISIDTVFKEYHSPSFTVDGTKLRGLVEFVTANEHYSQYKQFLSSVGGLHCKTLDDLAGYLHTIVEQGFQVRDAADLELPPRQ